MSRNEPHAHKRADESPLTNELQSNVSLIPPEKTSPQLWNNKEDNFLYGIVSVTVNNATFSVVLEFLLYGIISIIVNNATFSVILSLEMLANDSRKPS